MVAEAAHLEKLHLLTGSDAQYLFATACLTLALVLQIWEISSVSASALPNHSQTPYTDDMGELPSIDKSKSRLD